MIACLRLKLLNERWKLSISNVLFWLILQSFIYFYSNEISKNDLFFYCQSTMKKKVVGNRAIRVWKMSIKFFLFFPFFSFFLLPLHSTKEKDKEASKQAAAALSKRKKIGIRHFNFHRNKFLLLYVLHCSSFYGPLYCVWHKANSFMYIIQLNIFISFPTQHPNDCLFTHCTVLCCAFSFLWTFPRFLFYFISFFPFLLHFFILYRFKLNLRRTSTVVKPSIQTWLETLYFFCFVLIFFPSSHSSRKYFPSPQRHRFAVFKQRRSKMKWNMYTHIPCILYNIIVIIFHIMNWWSLWRRMK